MADYEGAICIDDDEDEPWFAPQATEEAEPLPTRSGVVVELATLAREQERRLQSRARCLQTVRIVLDPAVMETDLGLALGSRLRALQAGPADKAIPWSVQDCGLGAGAPCIRWYRKIAVPDMEEVVAPDPPASAGQLAPPRSAPSRAAPLPEREEPEPHAMACFTAEAFCRAWEKDRLESVIMAIRGSKSNPRQAHLLVAGLDRHLARQDRASMQEEVGSRSAPEQTSAESASSALFSHRIRREVERWAATVCVHSPGLGFRDASDAAQAAEHALAATAAIAAAPHKLAAQRGATAELLKALAGPGRAVEEVLARHPLRDGTARAAVRALAAVPGVAAQCAHAVAARAGSLGGTVDLLLRLRGEGLLLKAASPPRGGRRRPAKNALAHEEREIAEMERPGGGRRVGPRAGKQLAALLLCTDGQRLVHVDEGEEDSAV